ncbi:hypothetical protein HRQ91_01345 [Treponema parvum]|uniref:MATE family efflux transporter n=1 Tax=Treponema parvum TaxID=138851 RepID=A0A975F2K3_9SPIR|nr:MATE family efflux transporter [Treponema parvum]QTQ13208.1 hypothetical protein HRQ91_01345 [Treponema parvum]
MADLFIIGQFEGVASTTAVSIGSQVMHMLTVIIVGLAMGTTVSIGQSVGAKNKKQAALNISNSVSLFMALSVLLTAVLLLLVKPIVSAMSTPEEAASGTTAYLTICFIGIPFITAYNIINSIFRVMDDSKSPMCFIAVACVVNIALDYLFMGVFQLGPAGGQYLRGYIWDCIFAGIHFSFSGYFCACGKSGLSFLHNIIAILLVRVPGVYLTSKLFPTTLLPMGLATATGSLVSVIVCVIAFIVINSEENSRAYNIKGL